MHEYLAINSGEYILRILNVNNWHLFVITFLMILYNLFAAVPLKTNTIFACLKPASYKTLGLLASLMFCIGVKTNISITENHIL